MVKTVGIVGAGAMGGLLAVRLSAAGLDTAVVDRGGHLAAMRRGGLRLLLPDGGCEQSAGLRAAAHARELGPVDLVILGVKAQDLPAVAPQLPWLYHEHTVVLTLQNGIPWWYFQRHDGPFAGARLESLDPEGVVSAHVPAERLLGGVAYPAATLEAPGVVRLIEGTRFAVGELDGSDSPRLAAVAQALRVAGFKCHALPDIRSELWLKAWGALAFNPLSALTRATLVDICRHGPTRSLAAGMMTEAQCIAEKLGARFRVGIEQRIAGAESVGAHKTSMLQDLEAGRSLEVEAVLGVVATLGRITGTPCPLIDAVHACVELLARGAQAQNDSAPARKPEPVAAA